MRKLISQPIDSDREHVVDFIERHNIKQEDILSITYNFNNDVYVIFYYINIGE